MLLSEFLKIHKDNIIIILLIIIILMISKINNKSNKKNLTSAVKGKHVDTSNKSNKLLDTVLLSRDNNKNGITNETPNETLDKVVKILTRQAARWSTAADQDESAMIAVLHANYGAGYLWALKDVASTEDVKLITGIDLLEFERHIVRIQDKVTRNMISLCPKYAPKSSYLTKIGGEG